VNVFFDTSVLVAASVGDHAHHAQALPAFQRVVASRDLGFISAHTIAELYSALTRVPVRPRIHPSEAVRMVTDDILPHFETVSISKHEYLEALIAVRDGGWRGGRVYDALQLSCARKAGVDRIYTFNLSDFRALAPPALHRKICSP